MLFLLIRRWFTTKSCVCPPPTCPWGRWHWGRSTTWLPLRPTSWCGSFSSAPTCGPCLCRWVELSWSHVSMRMFVSESLCVSADCDGSYPALLSTGLQCFSRSVSHHLPGPDPIPHSHEAGRHAEKLISKQRAYIPVYVFCRIIWRYLRSLEHLLSCIALPLRNTPLIGWKRPRRS